MTFADDFEPKRLNSQAAMFKALGVKEIADNILERLSFASRAQLSRSCSDAMLATSSFQTLYDMTRNNFQYSEYTEEEFAKMKQAHIVPEDQQQRGTKVSLRPISLKACASSISSFADIVNSICSSRKLISNIFAKHPTNLTLLTRACFFGQAIVGLPRTARSASPWPV